jgi:hypothetical protein
MWKKLGFGKKGLKFKINWKLVASSSSFIIEIKVGFPSLIPHA